MVWWMIAAAFPALWGWAFYRADRYEKEPPWMLGLAFVYGCLAFFMASWLEDRFLPSSLSPDDPLLKRLGGFLLVVGPVEELCKFLPVRLHLCRLQACNEPMDAILYSVMAAIGFATMENFRYMHGPTGGSLALMTVGRGAGATLAHILFAGFWGSALGWSKAMTDRRAATVTVVIGLVWASLAHGLFDSIQFSVGQEIPLRAAQGLLLVLMVGSYLALRRQMARATDLSPFRPMVK